eukprot:891457-Prorocentrum_minimum.AAC.1
MLRRFFVAVTERDDTTRGEVFRGPAQGIFPLPERPLVLYGEHCRCLTAHWSCKENIPAVWQPICPAWGIFPSFDSPLAESLFGVARLRRTTLW